MIQHIWSVLSRESKIDAETNLLSIFDVYEDVGIEVGVKEPVPHGQALRAPLPNEVTSTFFRDNSSKEDKFKLRIVLKDPDNKELARFEAEVKIEIGKSRMRTRIKAPTLPVTKSGVYIYRVSMEVSKDKFKEVAVLPFSVKVNIKVDPALSKA